MPIYIAQGRYSRDAVQGMLAAPEDRSKAVSKLFKEAGGKLIGALASSSARRDEVFVTSSLRKRILTNHRQRLFVRRR